MCVHRNNSNTWLSLVQKLLQICLNILGVCGVCYILLPTRSFSGEVLQLLLLPGVLLVRIPSRIPVSCLQWPPCSIVSRTLGPQTRGELPAHKYWWIFWISILVPTWAISSFSRRVKSLGSLGPEQLMAESRMWVITGPCLSTGNCSGTGWFLIIISMLDMLAPSPLTRQEVDHCYRKYNY